MEPVTITLASLRLAVTVVAVSKSAISGVKAIAAFPNDIRDLIGQLEWKQLLLETMVYEQPLLKDKIMANEAHRDVVRRRLAKLQENFETCRTLIEKYQAEDLLQHPSNKRVIAELDNPNGNETSVSVAEDLTARSDSNVEPSSSKSSNRKSKLKSDDKRRWKRLFKKGKPKSSERDHLNDPSGDDTIGGRETAFAQGAIDTLLNGEVSIDDVAVQAEVSGVAQRNKAKRLPWIAGDKATFVANLASIGKTINDLGAFLRSVSPNSAGWRLPVSDKSEAHLSSPEHDRIAVALRQVHEILVAANNRAGTAFYLTLKLEEDHDQSRDDLQNHLIGANFGLTAGSSVFDIQKHLTSNFTDAGHIFIVEHVIGPSQDHNDDLQRLEHDSQDNSPSWNMLERWGTFRSDQDTAQSVIVYHLNKPVQKCPTTLANILQDGQYTTHMNPIYTIQLSRLILYTHLYLARLPSTQAHACLSSTNFRYYCSEPADPLWGESGLLILRPWLAVGLGSRAPGLMLGSRSGVAPAQDYVIAKLGILLFQLGSAVKFDEKKGTAFLKDQAFSNMSLLQSRMGLPYAELVGTLLEHVDVPAKLATPDDHKMATSIVKKCISSLTYLELQMEGTSSVNNLGYTEIDAAISSQMIHPIQEHLLQEPQPTASTQSLSQTTILTSRSQVSHESLRNETVRENDVVDTEIQSSEKKVHKSTTPIISTINTLTI